MDWKLVALVGAASGVGGAFRYLVAGWTATPGFPTGTLVVNVVGSLALGFLLFGSVLGGWLSGTGRVVLGVGLLGGFTTMSAFSVETFSLVEDGKLATAGTYIALTLLLCVGGAWLGRAIALWAWPAGA